MLFHHLTALLLFPYLTTTVLASPFSIDFKHSPFRNITSPKGPIENPRPASPQSANDHYKELVSYAASAYCSNLEVGSRVGSDGSLLWKMGDGNRIQQVFVAYSESLGIVISHEGTNKTSFSSIQNDLSAQLVDPYKELQFLDPGVRISRGFQEAWKDTADQVLEQVKKAREKYPDAAVIQTGHSLGAAIGLLGSLHLKHNLNIDIETILFGLPRTGNKEFADAVDSMLPNLHHIVNFHDPIPHLPGKHIGFWHPSGEIWIANGKGDIIDQCVGQENSMCSDSVNPFQYDINDHHNYLGVSLDCPVKL